MRGTIRLDGQDTAQISPSQVARLGVAHVPEGRGIFYGLTVAEHFRLGRGASGSIRTRPTATSRRLRSCATGRRTPVGRRAADARRRPGTVAQPRVLLLDELSLGLAPVIVERLLPVVREYATENGCAVVLVEQHVGLALDVADRAYVLSHGQVVLHRPAAELRNHELLLASYLGEGVATGA